MEIKERIIEELTKYDKKVDYDVLADGMDAENSADIRHAVKELISEGKILTSKKGKLFLPGAFGYYSGRLDVKRQGFAFLLDDQGDIFIPADRKKGALNEDLVMVRLLLSADGGKKREGEVVDIIEEKPRLIIGTLSGKFVIPDDERLDDIYVPKKGLNGAKNGQKVVVELTKRASGQQSPEGNVTEILGTRGRRQCGAAVLYQAFSSSGRVSKRRLGRSIACVGAADQYKKSQRFPQTEHLYN